MSNNATCAITGALGRDPEMRFSPAGMGVCKFSLAVNERKKENGEWVEGEPSWYDVTVFGEMAEHVSESVGKGDRVNVIGQLRQERWETETGDKRSKVVVIADSVGPDLRFAVARPQKAEKGGNGGAQQSFTQEAPREENPFA